MKKIKSIKIYTKKYCPYCMILKNYLENSGLSFENISVDKNEKLYNELKKSTGHYTVPQVFIDGTFIGGSEEFFDLIEGQ